MVQDRDISQVDGRPGIAPELFLQSITAQAIGVPGVMWAASYGYDPETNRWDCFGREGVLPSVLQGFALPAGRLPPPIKRALETGSIEHSRLFSIWLQEETGTEIPAHDLDALASLLIVPVRLSLETTALLLLGCSARELDLTLFHQLQERLELQSGTLDEENHVQAIALGPEDADPLAHIHQLLSQNVALFQGFMAIEMMRAIRYHHHLSLLTFALRHPQTSMLPEKVLVGTAQVLRGRLRRLDIIGRAGPHVIAALLPETGEGNARWISPRLRLAVLRYLRTVDRAYELEIGVASKPRPRMRPEEMIAEALHTVIEAPLGIRYLLP